MDALAPVTQVTLLEDRAQVRRAGTVTLPPGQHKVVVKDVAPLLQDLSLRAVASTNAKVIDARVRRAMRVHRDEKPEVARALETDLEKLDDRLRNLAEDRASAGQRRARLEEVLDRGFTELPEDISFGLVQPAWKETLDGLFQKIRALNEEELVAAQQIGELTEERQRLATQRQAFDRPDTKFVAWLEAEVLVSGSGPVELTFEYTVPNALWRPLHGARLAGGRLEFESRAMVWQNTGEDWNAVRLVFSTARASLGTEPPLLSDDLLAAQKKSDKVVVQARQVAIQKAKADDGAHAGPPPATVDLPGVDDGGEIRNLEAQGPCTVPSDGRPNLVPLFSFVATPKTKRVAFPELELRAFLKSVQKNEAKHPILAGPVELQLESGFVGWTKVLFVAPGEEFALSFGPDDAIRLSRTDKQKQVEGHIDKWKTTSTAIAIYLSNLSGEPKDVEVCERMPVSEIEHVKVELNAKKTAPAPTRDANGFAIWQVALPANGQAQLGFAFDVSTAPGVQGM